MLAALLSSAGRVASGQQLRLEDVPRNGLSPETIDQSPLDEAHRAVLHEALKSREYARAETLLVDQINHNPKSPVLLTLLGGIFFLDGQYMECAIAMKKADSIAPLDHRNRFTLALAYIILNHRDWARPELERLAKSDAKNPLYPYWLGRIDYDAMQFKAAVANFQNTLRLDAHYLKGYDNLGLSYEALGEYDNAISTYEKAIALNRAELSPSPWPPLNLGTLLVKLGKLEDAEKYLQESLRCDPRFPRAHYQMGLLLEKQSKYKEALEELNLAVNNDPAFPEPHYSLGRIYQRLGDKQKATAAWNTFQRLRKDKRDERPH